MFKRILNFTKRNLEVVLLFAGLIILSCTIFCLLGYGFRASLNVEEDSSRKLLLVLIYNFFLMIGGGTCYHCVTDFNKIEFEPYGSIITLSGIVLLVAQGLIILLSIAIILLSIFKKNLNKRYFMVLLGVTAIFAIVCTVLVLTPQNYVKLYDFKHKKIVSIADLLKDAPVNPTIELTKGQISHLVLSILGVLFIIGSVFITMRRNRKQAVDTTTNQNANA